LTTFNVLRSVRPAAEFSLHSPLISPPPVVDLSFHEGRCRCGTMPMSTADLVSSLYSSNVAVCSSTPCPVECTSLQHCEVLSSQKRDAANKHEHDNVKMHSNSLSKKFTHPLHFLGTSNLKRGCGTSSRSNLHAPGCQLHFPIAVPPATCHT
jgi:hypothetical protein